MREKVERALEAVRPYLQADGGDLELIGIEGGVVRVRLVGTCGGCPMSLMTLKQGIEARLKAEVPEIERVEAL